MNKTLFALLSLAVGASAPVLAEDAATPPPEQAAPSSVDAPPPPMPSDDREQMAPEVTIIRNAERTVEEYRINGQLYMVKVTPSKGPSYYLVDADGDGNLETQRSELDPKILVPSWVILRW